MLRSSPRLINFSNWSSMLSPSKMSNGPPGTLTSTSSASNSLPTSKLPTLSSMQMAFALPIVARYRPSLNEITSTSMSGVTSKRAVRLSSKPPLIASLCARRQRALTTAMRIDVSIEAEMPPATSVPNPTLSPKFMVWFTLKQASPRKKLLSGQWLTDVPRSTSSRIASSSSSVPCAISDLLVSSPASSNTSASQRCSGCRWREKLTSPQHSLMCDCTWQSYFRAMAAKPFMLSIVHVGMKRGVMHGMTREHCCESVYSTKSSASASPCCVSSM
mmetsp:Transcript_17503/g.52623  ORF Transcript_17503/g.52623 Transcript_17503/m.52623 type:complete len:274 (-) Transcript_17503:122-943(-)